MESLCPAGLEVIANIGKATSRSTFIYLVDYTIMSLIVSSILAQLYLQSKTKYTMVDCFPTSHFRAFDLHKTELEEETRVYKNTFTRRLVLRLRQKGYLELVSPN